MLKSRRGITLGTTILMLALLTTLAFTMAGGLVGQLNLTSQTVNRERAMNLADSAVADAIEAIQANPDFGVSADGTVLTVTPEDAQNGETGLVTFDPDKASKLGIPASINNLSRPDSKAGTDGAAVPPFTARLVGVGRCGGVEERVEVMLRMPVLPALVCEGKIVSTGSLLVAAVSNLDQVGPLVNDPSQRKLPADLASNLKAKDAISLGKDTTISGDIQSAGGVEYPVDESVHIMGEIRTSANPMPLPILKPGDYDPAASTLPYTNMTWAPEMNPTFSGRIRVPTSLTVEGNLNLDTAFLYVNGDLTVNGALKGRGGVVVTGRAKIAKGASLDAGNRVSLLVEGDIELSGDDQKTSFLQGLVYTRGNLTARQLTVAGAVVCAQAPGTATLESANLILVPGTEALDLNQPLVLKFSRRPKGKDPVTFVWTAAINKVPEGTTVTYTPKYAPKKEGADPQVTQSALFEMVYARDSSSEETHQNVAANDQMQAVLTDFFKSNPQAVIANDLGELYMEFSSGDSFQVADKGMHEDCLGGKGGGIESGTHPGITQVLEKTQAQNAAFPGPLGFDLDPNKIIPWEDRLRIALWHRM